MSSHDYVLGHNNGYRLGYDVALDRAAQFLAQKDAMIRTMRTAADTKNQIISDLDNEVRSKDSIIAARNVSVQILTDTLTNTNAAVEKKNGIIAALQQSLDEATARINAEADAGFRVGDEVRHDSSERTYQIHALRRNGTEAQFVGYLEGWHSPEGSWFPLTHYKKIKE